jgi:tetratricopeptide (TPR) repeat protein
MRDEEQTSPMSPVISHASSLVAEEVLGLLARLVEKSLVEVDEQGPEVRYRLLETVRQYSRDRLLEAGEAEGVSGRHLDYFLQLSETAELIRYGPDHMAWLDLLETEHDNLRSALEWSREAGGGGELGLRLAGALGGFWMTRGYLAEGRAWLDDALARSPDAAARWRAKALNRAGYIRRLQSDYRQTEALYQEALALYRQAADQSGIAHALHNLGDLARQRGDYAAARSLFEESLAIRRELDDEAGIAYSLYNLGIVVAHQGDYGSAREFWEESLVIGQAVGDKGSVAASLMGLAGLAFDRGSVGEARALYEQSLALRRELGFKTGIAASLNLLAAVTERQGDAESARAHYRESLGLWRELGDTWGIIHVLCRLAAMHSDPKRSARLHGAADALLEGTDASLRRDELEALLRATDTLRAQLGETAFTAAWFEGRAMSLDQAIEYALDLEPPG